MHLLLLVGSGDLAAASRDGGLQRMPDHCFVRHRLFAVTSATLSAQGQEPWLVVWKKGVDGQALWKTLCPSISITDDPQMMLESLAAAPGPSADSLLRASAAAELALNCGSRFSQLLNGFAGVLPHCAVQRNESSKASKHQLQQHRRVARAPCTSHTNASKNKSRLCMCTHGQLLSSTMPSCVLLLQDNSPSKSLIRSRLCLKLTSTL